MLSAPASIPANTDTRLVPAQPFLGRNVRGRIRLRIVGHVTAQLLPDEPGVIPGHARDREPDRHVPRPGMRITPAIPRPVGPPAFRQPDASEN